MKKCPGCKIIAFLAGLGAVNWLLVTLLHFNLVTAAFGNTAVAKVIYSLIGICGIAVLVSLVKPCPCSCSNKS